MKCPICKKTVKGLRECQRCKKKGCADCVTERKIHAGDDYDDEAQKFYEELCRSCGEDEDVVPQ